MLFTAPELTGLETEVLEDVIDLRRQLRHRTFEPRRWYGPLRRLSFARAIQGSNSIEGYVAGLDDAAAVVDGEETLDADEETRRALEGYWDAMTYVLRLADEPTAEFEYGARLIKSLHYMMTSYDLANRPGQWRKGDIYVKNEDTGQIVYEGPDLDHVSTLISELTDELNDSEGSRPIVTAGMAHLNLVMVHPFRDGNGRMARCLQSLVLAREGVPLAPVFLSIEEYLGRNTQRYYDVLAEVGGGSYQPERDARPWMRFMMTAHLHQGRTLLRRVHESEQLWDQLEQIAGDNGLPERSVVAMFDAAIGLRVRNATYRAACNETDVEMSENMASRDLRQLVETGLLVARGERRGRHYLAGTALVAARADVVAGRSGNLFVDPFRDS